MNESSRRKRELRAQMRALRQAIPAPARMAAAEAVANRLLASEEIPASGHVAGYWAHGGELPLHVLQVRLAPGQVWCLPCVRADGALGFAPWRSGDPLVSNRYGIPEPDLAPTSQLEVDQMAVVLLPLLGFDRRGRRLGMGAGYYDRTLASRGEGRSGPRLVGVAYACQEVAELPAEPWDVPLDAIVTERELILPAPPGDGRRG